MNETVAPQIRMKVPVDDVPGIRLLRVMTPVRNIVPEKLLREQLLVLREIVPLEFTWLLCDGRTRPVLDLRIGQICTAVPGFAYAETKVRILVVEPVFVV